MINTKKPTIIAAFIIALLFAGAANATSYTKSLPIDHRVHIINYQPDQVFKIVGHYSYQSAIEFGPGEEIKTISMGDSTAWMLNPAGNRMFFKPVEQDATTNMTLITNKRTYLFEFHAREAEDIDDPNLAFIIRFVYPSSGDAGGMGGGSAAYLDSVPDPETVATSGKYNTNYTISGSDEVAPIRIFDDGEFTYFQFHDINAELPAFYIVDGQNKEYIVNYRTRGSYIVVERVASRFTLRHGADIVCVFNEDRLANSKAR